MACLAMHLAIAKKYLDNNPNENEEAFVKGAYLPDVADDKILSHYGIRMPIKRVKDMLDSKVDIVECAKSTNLKDDLSKAVFLHLTTDYLFYNFVYTPSLESKSPEQIKNMMYQDYDFVTNHVIKNYNIVVPQEVSHIVKSKEGNIDSMFFNTQQIDRFVELTSKLNLKNCKKQIMENCNAFLNNFLEKMGKTCSKNCK